LEGDCEASAFKEQRSSMIRNWSCDSNICPQLEIVVRHSSCVQERVNYEPWAY
jgi:hypothetical protein